MRKIYVLIYLSILSFSGFSQNKVYYFQSGSYTTASNWNTNPGGGGAAASVFTFATDTWIVDNTSLTMASAWTIAGTLQVGAGVNASSVSISAAVSVGGCVVDNNGTLTITTNPTFTGGGNILVNSGGTLNQNAASTAASPVMAATQAGTVVYGAGASHVLPVITYSNLTLNDAITFTTAGNITVNGALTINSSNTLNMAGFVLGGSPSAVSNNGTITTSCPTTTSATPLPSGQTWGGTINYALATGAQTIVAGTFNNLTLSNTSATNTAGGNITVNGTMSTSSGGTFDLSTYALAGTLTSPGLGTIKTENTGGAPLPSGITWAGTVNYDAAGGGQTIVAGTYTNLSTGSAVTTGTNTAGGNLTVNTLLTTVAGNVLDLSTFEMLGTLTTVTNNGTIQTENTSSTPFTTGKTWTGTIKYAATGGGQTIVAGTYATLVAGAATGTGTNTAGGAITVNTALTTVAGYTLDMSTFALGGTLTTITNNGILQTENASVTPFPAGKTWGGTGVVNYHLSTGAQTVMAGTYTKLTLSNTSGTSAASAAITVTGNLTTTAGGTMNMGVSVLTLTGATITNNGTVETTVGAGAFVGVTNWGTAGTVTYNDGAAQAVIAGTYNNLTVGNGAFTYTASGNINVNGTLTVNAGSTLSMSTFVLGGATTSISNSGTISTGCLTTTSSSPLPTGLTWGGSVTYAAATGAQTIVAGTYSNLTMSNTSGTNTAGGNVTVNGTLTTSTGGTLDMSTYTLGGTITSAGLGIIKTENIGAAPLPSGISWAGTVNYDATGGGQTIVPGTYTNLSTGSAVTAGTNTAGGNLTVNTLLTTIAGNVLDMSTYQLLGTLTTVTNNGTIQTENLSSTPFTTGKTWTGTIKYDATGGGQTIMAGTYATLVSGAASGSGTNTASGAITVNTALTTTAGYTLDMSTFAVGGTMTTITNNGVVQTENTSATPFTTGKTWGGSGVVNYNVPAGGQTVMAGTYSCGLTVSNTSGTNTASGALVLNGSLTTTAGGTLSMAANAITGTLSAVTNNGTISTTSTANPPIPTGKNWSGTGTTGKIVLAATGGGQFIPGGTYYNLTCSNTSGTNTADAALTVNGSLTTTSGGTLAMATYALAGSLTSVTNNGTVTTSSTVNPAIPAGMNWTGTTGAVSYTLASGGQYVPAGTYKTLTFANTSGTNTAVGNLVVNTSMTTSGAAGTLDMGTYSLGGTLTTLTNTGTIKTQNTSTAPLPSGRVIAGTVNYYAPTGGQTIAAETSYSTLTLSNTSGTNTSAGNLSVTTLNTTASGTLDMTAAYRIAAMTTVTNNGIIESEVPTSVSATPFPSGLTWGGTGTVIYNAATGAQTVMAGTYTCKLEMANTSGTNTASGVLTCNNGLITTSGGTLNMGTFAIAGTTTPTNNGTISTSSVTNPAIPSGKNWTGTTGTVIFAALTGGQSIPLGTYGVLKLSNTSGTNTAIGALTISSALITTSGGTLGMGANQLLGVFTPTNNGTIATSCTTNPAIPAGQNWSGTTGAVTYALTTGGQSIPSGTYQNLTLSNTSGTNTAVGNIAMSGGTLTTTAGGTLSLGTSYVLSGTGTFTNNGIISTSVPTATSSTPIPAGITWGGTINYAALTGAQTIVSGTYNNLTLSNTTGINTAGGNITVNTGTLTTTAGGTLDMGATGLLSGTGTFTNNGTIQTEVPTSLSTTPIPSGKAWGGTITYGATTGAQTIVSETSYTNLKFGNTSGTNTNAANLVVNGGLTTATGAGTIDLGTFTLSGTLSSIAGTGTIATANTTAAPIKTAQTWTQTINYYKTTGAQTIVSGTYSGGLTNSNTSGTNTLAAAITVGSALTLSAGSTLADGGFTLTLTGNILGTGTHTGSGKIQMTGSGATISGVTLANLTLNNAGVFSLTGNPQINGTLTLTSGRLNIGTYTLTFGSAAPAVAGTLSSSNMIIANGGGNVQKLFTANGAYLFPIGDNVPNYSPITLTFTGGTYGGGAYGSVNVSNSKHPQNANTNNYINRYWTVSTNAITSAVYSVSATYVTGDVSGTESSISVGQYQGSLPWIKYGATNTGTHTLTVGSITSTSSAFSGISTAAPTVSVAPSSSAICSGSSVSLTATGVGNPTLSYSWAPSTGLSATTGATVTATPTTSTVTTSYVYTVTVTDGNGFKGIGTTIFTVNPTPSISGATSACVGLTTALTGSIGGGTWSSGNTAIGTVGLTSGIVTGISAGTVVVSYTLGTGCTTNTPVTVNAAPTAIGGATSFCQNATTTLTESSGGVWSSGNSAVATVGSTGIVTGVSSGTVTITFTGGVGCYVTSNLTVNPIQPIGGTLSSCVGSSTNLTDGIAGGTWSSSNTSVATIDAGTGVVSGLTSGSTVISYILGTGCNTSNIVSIDPLPSAISGVGSACVGLTDNLTDGGGGTWTSSNLSVATVGLASGIVTGVASGTAVITFTSGSNCYVTTTETVNPLPAAISGAASVCAGSSLALTDGTTGGLWSCSNSDATIGATTGTLSGVVAGSSIVTYTIGTGCIATTPITINPLPANITGTLSVCTGLTTTLSNSTSGGTWASSNTNAAIGSATGIVTGISAGSSMISYTLVATGCMATEVVVVINPLPAGIGGATSVCSGYSTTLTDATSSGTWSSSNTGIATAGLSTGVITGVSAGTVTVSFTLTTGCLVTIPFTVYPLPAAISGASSLCSGTTATVTNSSGAGTWTSSNTSVATIDASLGTVVAVSAGTLEITYTLGTGCYVTQNETVNPLPVSISGPATYCIGDEAMLTDATPGGTWTISDITIASLGSATGDISAESAGPATVTYTLPTTCAATSGIIVNETPAEITGAIDTCVGLSVALGDATTGGTWTSSNITIATVGSLTGVVSGVAAGEAVITYTLGTGCYAVVGMPFDPLPSAIEGVLSVCNGAAAILTDTLSGGTWLSSNASVATIDSDLGVITTIGAGTATITYLLNSGCNVYSTLTVNATPIIGSIANNGPLCGGNTLLLTSSGSGGTGTLGYTWSGPNSFASTGQNTSVPGATPLATGTYSVTVTDVNGCSALDSTSALIYPQPALGFVSNSGPVCSGDTIYFTSSASGGTGSLIYGWAGPNSFTSASADTLIAAPSTLAAGIYSVTVTDSNGCVASGTNSTTVVVNASPVITSITNSGPICAGNNLNVTSAVSDVSGPIAYSWVGPNGFSSATENNTISAATTLATGIYSLTVTDANGCVAMGSTSATVNPLPTSGSISGSPSVCIGYSVTLTATVSGGIWSASNSNASVGSLSATTADVAGVVAGEDVISYTVVNSYGCSAATYSLMMINTPPGYIVCNAGTGVSGYTGDGGPGILARLNTPRAITNDASGNTYICDLNNNVIREVSTSGIITTVVGTGVAGSTGDGGPATAATLNGPNGIYVDASGNIFISNTSGNTIRKVNASTGIISTVAGNGTAGFSGDGGPALSAQLNAPLGLCTDASGNIYVADQSNYRVREINVSTGKISTIAGNGTRSYSGDGGAGATAGLNVVRDVRTDNSGNLYIADAGNQVIRLYNLSTGIITTFAGTHGSAGSTGDGGPATAAKLNTPARLVYDGGNILYVADQLNYKIRQVNLSTGIITTLAGTGALGYAGDGGGSTSAEFNQPSGVSCDNVGNIYVSDALNNVVRSVATKGSISILLTGPSTVPPSTPVSFTAYPSVTGLPTSFQWTKNGSDIGSGSSTFTDASPSNGDVYRCILSVDPECGASYLDTSNSIVISISGGRYSNPGDTSAFGLGGNSSFRMYPDPVMDNLTIEGSGLDNGMILISVYNQMGKMVINQTFVAANNQLMEVLDMGSLPGGVYLVSITDMAGRNRVLKCLKN